MSNVALITYPLSDAHIAGIHKAGCADIKKDAVKHGTSVRSVETYESVDAALAACIDEEMRMMEYEEADVKIFSCAKGK